MPREDIAIANERIATLRERAENQLDFSYVENEGAGTVRFDRGDVSAWATTAGPDPINYSGDKKIITQLKKIDLT